MVRAAASAPAQAESSLRRPTFFQVFRTGAPGFLREGFIPLGAFYAGLKLEGLAGGIAAGAAASILIYLYERRAGRDGLLVRLALAFVAVQSVVGLLSHSTTVYLAQPVVFTAIWGLMFLVSVPLGRPLAGSLASAWYPFPKAFRETPEFKRVYGVESVVWGLYFIGRSGVRLATLLHGSLENFLLITFLTGTPLTILLLVWSIHYSIRKFSEA
jgi:hypothetical protein